MVYNEGFRIDAIVSLTPIKSHIHRKNHDPPPLFYVCICVCVCNNTDFVSVCLSLDITNGLSCHAKLFEFSVLAFHGLC